MWLFRWSGVNLPRPADRQLRGLWYQLPPRITRNAASREAGGIVNT